MTDPTTPATPAGWYPDGVTSGQERYWDGTGWSTHFRPIGGGTTVTEVLAPAPGVTHQPAAGATLSPAPKKRKWPWIVGGIVGVIVLFSIIGALNGGGDNDTAADPAAVVEEAPAEEAPAEEAPAEEPAPEPVPEVASGEWSNPMPQPYIAKGILGGEKYSLTAGLVNADASAQVLEWNQFNTPAPAGFKYVIVQLNMTGIDPDGVEPSLAAFDLFLSTAEGNKYSSEFIVMGEGMPSMSDGPTLYPGSAFTGFTAYMVPADAATFMLYDNSNYIAF